jgi:polyribonucleotide nucleotidyltransferase
MKPPYTRAQVNAASPKRDAVEGAYTHNHYHVFDSLTAVLTEDKPTLQHWCELASACNVLEALRQQGHIMDSDGLVADAFDALKKARQRDTIRLDGAGRNAVILMLESYVVCCKELPERVIKSAVNFAHNAQQHTKNNLHNP